MDKIDELLTRGVENIYPNKEALEKVLRSGKKLRLYQGFDPTMPSLHLGNWAGVQKLRQFQELGHEVIFMVGDFTGMIGDPTDKTATRQMLTLEKTKENSITWKSQASKLLKFEGQNAAKMLFNSDWNVKINFKDVIELTANFTAQQMLERNFFQKRLQEGKPIHIHELLYPIVQAYDSVVMDVDLEIGGTDQMFNMMCGRTLLAALKNKEKFVMTTKLLVDNAGNKVGKTTGNALFLNSTPEEMFGGIMSFPDEVVALSFELLTTVPLDKIPKNGHPMELKKKLALQIVSELHSKDAAEKAQEEFENTFQKGEVAEDLIQEIKVRPGKITDQLVEAGIVTSKSEAKRLEDQGAIEEIKPGLFRIGKKRFVKIT